MKRMLHSFRILIVYVLTFHVVRMLADCVLPNAHVFNKVRGAIFRPFFHQCGSGLALANGLIINGPWGLAVGNDVYIAHRCWINASGGLTIDDGVVISPNVVIATTSHKRIDGVVSLRESDHSPIVIGRGAWIASNSVITKGSVIGEGAIIAAGSVVFGYVPPRTLYRGNPAVWVKDLDASFDRGLL